MIKHKIAASAVHNTLRLPRCTGRVEDIQWIFRIHLLRRALRALPVHEAVIPVVRAFIETEQVVLARQVFYDHDMLNTVAVLQSPIGIALQGDDLPSPPTAVGGDDDFAARIETAGQESPDALDAIEKVIEDALGLPDEALEIDFDIDSLALVIEVEWKKLFSEDFNFSFDLESLANMAGLDLAPLGDIDSLNNRLGAGSRGNLHLAAQVTVGAAVEISLLPLADGNAPTTIRLKPNRNETFVC